MGFHASIFFGGCDPSRALGLSTSSKTGATSELTFWAAWRKPPDTMCFGEPAWSDQNTRAIGMFICGSIETTNANKLILRNQPFMHLPYSCNTTFWEHWGTVAQSDNVRQAQTSATQVSKTVPFLEHHDMLLSPHLSLPDLPENHPREMMRFLKNRSDKSNV